MSQTHAAFCQKTYILQKNCTFYNKLYILNIKIYIIIHFNLILYKMSETHVRFLKTHAML